VPKMFAVVAYLMLLLPWMLRLLSTLRCIFLSFELCPLRP
jgi:flagellar biosynthesis protein FliQ